MKKRLASIFVASAVIDSCFDFVRDIESYATFEITRATRNMTYILNLYSRKDATLSENDIENSLAAAQLIMNDIQDLKPPSGT